MFIKRILQTYVRKRRILVLVILVIVLINVLFVFHHSTNDSSLPNLRYLEHQHETTFSEERSTVDFPVLHVSETNIETERDSSITGTLNVHIWEDICDCRLENFRRHLSFPPRRIQIPDIMTKIDGIFQISWGQNGYAQRIFGFIHPPITGKYKFAISADDEAELYLSTDESPEKITQIANVTVSPGRNCDNVISAISGNYVTFPSQISQEIFLEEGKKYFIDVLHKEGPGDDNVEVAWLLPGEEDFEIIEDQFSLYINNTEGSLNDFEYELKIPNYDPFKYEHKHQHTKYETSLESIDFLKMKFVNSSDFVDVLPYCQNYSPSYLVPKSAKLELYETYYHHIIHTAHYPNWDKKWKRIAGGSKVFINNDEAESVVKTFMEYVKQKHPGKYSLAKMVNIEMKWDRRKGKRYFIELVLNVKGEKEPRRFSEYIFQPKSGGQLCYPPGLQWNKTALINIVATVKNQGHWIKHLIQNLQDIMHETGDRNFNLVIFDYESTDYDLRDVLYKSNLPSYQFVSQPGLYSRAESFNAAAEVVTDPNSIIFACDLHLDIPRNLFDMLRKHTISNQMVYGPMIIRLGCGATPEKPQGYWEWAGFGIISLTKADWDAIGGYNEEKYKTTWGGEDWEMLDRVAKRRLDIERLMFPNFYHYFHTRKKLWGNDIKNKAKKKISKAVEKYKVR